MLKSFEKILARFKDRSFLSPMNALLLTDYIGQTVEGWLASEKIDGIRALWNGREFISRNGVVFTVPDWFKAGMPECPLDGELFAGSLGLTISATQAGRWSEVRFYAFDAPSADQFKDRVARLATMPLPAHCEVVPHWTTDTVEAIRKADEIASNGGEGLVVRNPSAPYAAGRSSAALKIKPTRSAEMIVHGFHGKGIIGDWNGVTVKLNTGEKVELGDRVTFAFSGMTDSGIPRCPSFIALRDYE
jgi:DNA ligase 1